MNQISIDPVIYPYRFEALIGNFEDPAFFSKAKKLCKSIGIKMHGDFSQAWGWCIASKSKSVSIILIDISKLTDTTAFKNRVADQKLLTPKQRKAVNKKRMIKTIRHECHHAAADLFRFIGEKSSELDTEPFVYLCDFIFNKIMERVKF